jgi:hypothetical protein
MRHCNCFTGRLTIDWSVERFAELALSAVYGHSSVCVKRHSNVSFVRNSRPSRAIYACRVIGQGCLSVDSKGRQIHGRYRIRDDNSKKSEPHVQP